MYKVFMYRVQVPRKNPIVRSRPEWLVGARCLTDGKNPAPLLSPTVVKLKFLVKKQFLQQKTIKMQHKTKFREHFLPIRVFLNSLNNDIVESNSVVVFKNKLQKYALEIHSHNYN
jgi:hypothetical protein